MDFTRNWLSTCALALVMLGCSADDDDGEGKNVQGVAGGAGAPSGFGGRSNAMPTSGQNPNANGGIATAGMGFGGNAVSLAGSSANPGQAGAPVQPVATGGFGHAGEPSRAVAGSVSTNGGSSGVGPKAMAGAAGRVASAGCGRVRYSNVDTTGAGIDAVEKVLDTLEERLLACNRQEFARDERSAAEFTLRIVIDEDGAATSTLRNRSRASAAFFECIVPIYRSADWSALRRLEEVSATVRFSAGAC